MKKIVSITLEIKLLREIERRRGDAPRSRFVEKLLREALREEVIGYA